MSRKNEFGKHSKHFTFVVRVKLIIRELGRQSFKERWSPEAIVCKTFWGRQKVSFFERWLTCFNYLPYGMSLRWDQCGWWHGQELKSRSSSLNCCQGDGEATCFNCMKVNAFYKMVMSTFPWKAELELLWDQNFQSFGAWYSTQPWSWWLLTVDSRARRGTSPWRRLSSIF